MSAPEFEQLVQGVGERVLALLDEPASAGGRTAWELKMELKVPSAVLFLALGRLAGAGAVRVEPQELTYRVRRNVPATVPSQS